MTTKSNDVVAKSATFAALERSDHVDGPANDSWRVDAMAVSSVGSMLAWSRKAPPIATIKTVANPNSARSSTEDRFCTGAGGFCDRGKVDVDNGLDPENGFTARPTRTPHFVQCCGMGQADPVSPPKNPETSVVVPQHARFCLEKVSAGSGSTSLTNSPPARASHVARSHGERRRDEWGRAPHIHLGAARGARSATFAPPSQRNEGQQGGKGE